MRILLVPLLLLLTTSAFAAQEPRALVIARQMDCVSKHGTSSDIGWNDVCYTPNFGLTREQAINKQLNALEETQTAMSAPPIPPMEVTAPAIVVRAPPAAAAPSAPAAQPMAPTQFQTPQPQPAASKLDAKKYWHFEDVPYWDKQKLDPRKVHSLSFDVQPFYYHYHESGVDISGMMVGGDATYTYRPPDSNILNNFVMNTYTVDAFYAGGKPDYKSADGVVPNEKNEIYDMRALLGKDYMLQDRSLITAYGGFGYRYLFNQINDRQAPDGTWGYDRRDRYYYIPLGFTCTIPGDGWQSKLNVEYDWFLFGRQTSDLTSINKHITGGTYDENPNFAQHHGLGVRTSWRLAFTTPKFNFYLEPFFRWWKVDDSSVFTVHETLAGGGQTSEDFIEPENYTYEVGSKFGLEF